MVDEELGEWRKEIDVLDNQIFELIEERFEVAKKIGLHKKKKGLEIMDKQREEEILKKKSEESDLDAGFVRELLELIMKESKRLQGDKK